MSSTATLPPLSVLIYREGRYWVAYCVELDILTADTDMTKVESDAVRMVAAQIQFAIANNLLGDLFRPPNSDLSQRLMKGVLSGELRVGIRTAIVDHSTVQMHVHEPTALAA